LSDSNNTDKLKRDDTVRGWLVQFVAMVGKAQALALTEQLIEWAASDDALARATWEADKQNYDYPFS